MAFHAGAGERRAGLAQQSGHQFRLGPRQRQRGGQHDRQSVLLAITDTEWEWRCARSGVSPFAHCYLHPRTSVDRARLAGVPAGNRTSTPLEVKIMVQAFAAKPSLRVASRLPSLSREASISV